MAYLADSGEWVFTGREHTSRRVTRRCIEDRQHRYVDDCCRYCGDPRGDARSCWFFNCGPDADRLYERLADVIPNPYDIARGGERTREWLKGMGTCDWCIERHKREDDHRHIRSEKAMSEARYIVAYRKRERAQEERREQWRLENQTRRELRQQRARLREGAQTLTAIRKLLRPGARPSQAPASEPARTSPTS